jgi:tetratricopeptide (TPR) repeat protein
VSGDEHPDTVTAMNNLAARFYTLGELDRARELQKRVLDIRRRVLGDEHRETLTVMNNLAETLRAQDDLTGARECQERALDVARRVLGDEHSNTLIAMNNLAGTLCALGMLDRTRELQKRALDISQSVLGDEHRITLIDGQPRWRYADAGCVERAFEIGLPLLQEADAKPPRFSRLLLRGSLDARRRTRPIRQAKCQK